MLSPIVEEEKGCLTTFKEKKQKEAGKCFGSQVVLVVHIFDGIGLCTGTWAPGLPPPAAEPCIHRGSLGWPQQTAWESPDL